MAVTALFTLDSQMLCATRRQALTTDAPPGVAGSVASSPVLYWLDRCLRHGMADSLIKLNPAILPDPTWKGSLTMGLN